MFHHDVKQRIKCILKKLLSHAHTACKKDTGQFNNTHTNINHTQTHNTLNTHLDDFLAIDEFEVP